MSRTTQQIHDINNLSRAKGDTYPPLQTEPTIESQRVIAGLCNTPVDSTVTAETEVIPHTDQLDQNTYEQLVDRIKTAAEGIVTAVDTDLSRSLQEQIDEWCELHGYDHTNSQITRTIIARQAAVNLLLKSTLYEWHHQHDDLRPLSGDIREARQQVAERTGTPAFEEYVLDRVVWLADETTLDPILEARDRLLESGNPAADIARLYADLIPDDSRRKLGQYRTPDHIGELMRTWAVTGDDVVLDPGMGAGVLSSPFHPMWKVSTDPAHVAGIDRSQLACLMGTTALTLARQAHDSHIGDFLSLSPDDLSVDVDAIVSNPPYTKGDSLPREYKKRINTQFEEVIGTEISARSPLHAYFIYHSRAFLSPGDRAAFITPHSFLGNRYGESVKRFLLKKYSIKALIQFNPERYPVFDNADTTAVISLLEARHEDKTGDTRFIRVDEEVDTSVIRRAVRDGQQGSTEWGFINCVPQTELQADQNWQVKFDPVEIDTSHLPTLDEILTIQRGPVTGKVNLFCLSQHDVDEYNLDEEHLSRIVRRPSHIQGYDYQDRDWEEARADGKEVWLFDPDRLPAIPDSIAEFKQQFLTNAEMTDLSELENEFSTVLEYLWEGVLEYDLSDTSTFSDRPYWYRPRRKEPTRVLVQNSGRNGFRFLLNETTVRNTNACLGCYDIALSETELKALLAYLNSGVFEEIVREYKQTRNGGFDKIEPNELEQTPVIDPVKMREGTMKTLANLFDELRKTARHGNNCDPVLDRIDTILKKALGRIPQHHR